MSYTLSSSEIIPVWNRTIEGKVQDMAFLKGQNEVLMLVGEGAGGQIQRRNPENGELIHTFPYPLSTGSKFVLTPDSLRFVLLNGNGGLVRSLDEQYTVSSLFDIEYEDTIGIKYSNIAIDPVRPHVYVASTGWFKKTNFPAPRNKIIAYNYETGEHIKDLTEYGEDEYTAIEVSHNGKYLATLNDNMAYLKVWDLESMEQIINEPLFDENSKTRCESRDIYFSKIDDNVIYISGNFTKRINSKDMGDGTFKFYINDKTRELLLPDAIYASGNLIFLNDETYLINSGSGFFGVLNLKDNNLDYYNDPSNIYKTSVIYNRNEHYFLGSSENKMTRFIYDGISKSSQYYEKEIIISPNPTNSFVNIEINCVEPFASYQINDINGLLISQSSMHNQNNPLQIDFSGYTPGVYFLMIRCGNESKSYKVVRE